MLVKPRRSESQDRVPSAKPALRQEQRGRQRARRYPLRFQQCRCLRARIHRSETLVLQIADIIDADNVAACIADWFIASDVRLAEDVGLSEIAFALRNSRDGFTLWVENGSYRPRPVILSRPEYD